MQCNLPVTDHFIRLSISSHPQLVIMPPLSSVHVFSHLLLLLYVIPHTTDVSARPYMIVYQITPVLTIILRLKSQLSNIYKSVVIKINYLDPVHANITQMEPRTDWSPDCHLTNCLSCDWSCQGCI